MQSHILSPELALAYINGGNGTCTLVSPTGIRYTYKFSKNDDSPIFVRLLTAPDEYQYIGFIKENALIAGKKGNAKHPAFVAMAWYINKASTKPGVASGVEFWHAGTCCKCGRELTVPESIASGIGPVCAQRIS